MSNEKFCSNSESVLNEHNVKSLLSGLNVDISVLENIEIIRTEGDLLRILQNPKWQKLFLLVVGKINACGEINDQLRGLLKYQIITIIGRSREIFKTTNAELIRTISSKQVFQKIFQNTQRNDIISPFSFHEKELNTWIHYMNQTWWTDEETIWVIKNILEPLNQIPSYSNSRELSEFKQLLKTKIRKDGILEKWIPEGIPLDPKTYTDFLFDIFGKKDVVHALARKNPESAIMLCQTYINEPWAEAPFQVWENKQNIPPSLAFVETCFSALWQASWGMRYINHALNLWLKRTQNELLKRILMEHLTKLHLLERINPQIRKTLQWSQ